MSAARQRLSGCNDDNNCVGGSGDSLIGPAAGVTWIGTLYSRLDHTSFREPSQAWKHMALADLITGVQTDADVSNPNQLAWGSTHPASSMRGGWGSCIL